MIEIIYGKFRQGPSHDPYNLIPYVVEFDFAKLGKYVALGVDGIIDGFKQKRREN